MYLSVLTIKDVIYLSFWQPIQHAKSIVNEKSSEFYILGVEAEQLTDKTCFTVFSSNDIRLLIYYRNLLAMFKIRRPPVNLTMFPFTLPCIHPHSISSMIDVRSDVQSQTV